MSAHQAAWEVAAVFCRRVSLLSLGKSAPSMVCSPGMCPHPAWVPAWSSRGAWSASEHTTVQYSTGVCARFRWLTRP